jgi:hypothetical protein
MAISWVGMNCSPLTVTSAPAGPFFGLTEM